MKLEPLKQWMCDTCGGVIERPKDGFVQWNRGADKKIDDFIIVHHRSASPRRDTKNGCYKYDSDSHLEDFLGQRGMVVLHSLLEPGAYHMPECELQVSNVRGWVDFYKRLQLPYYEEARQYWGRATSDGYFVGSNETYIYMPQNLKEMIEHYEREDK